MKTTRFVFAALLASAAITPAFSQEEPRGDRGRGERIERGDQARPQGWSGERRGGGEQQQQRFEQRQQQVQAQIPQAAPPQPVAQQPQRDWSQGRGNGGQGRGGMTAPRDASAPVMQGQAQAQTEWRGRGNWNHGDANRAEGVRPNPAFNNGGNWAQRDRDGDGIRNRRDWDQNNDGRVDRRWDGNRNGVVDRRFDQNRDGVRDRREGQWNGNRGWNQNRGWNDGYNNHNWNRDWRQDNRYDWQRYRYSNRDRYRLPRYYSPYSYGYQRFGIGIYLDDLFFGSRYRISDPWQYRLPPAQWPYEWIRYYDDVLLVDTRTGYVADVIYDFFW